jgi:hypothetical protein
VSPSAAEPHDEQRAEGDRNARERPSEEVVRQEERRARQREQSAEQRDGVDRPRLDALLAEVVGDGERHRDQKQRAPRDPDRKHRRDGPGRRVALEGEHRQHVVEQEVRRERHVVVQFRRERDAPRVTELEEREPQEQHPAAAAEGAVRDVPRDDGREPRQQHPQFAGVLRPDPDHAEDLTAGR